MRSLLFVLFAISLLSVRSEAQDKCGFGGEENFNKTERLLKRAKSCKEAAATLHVCAWGSSADSMFASIVISKCEQTFQKKLTPAADLRFQQEKRLCGMEYEKQSGTMHISAAAMCVVDVTTNYSSTPAKWTSEPLRASFDCDIAASAIEKEICSDRQVGDADLVLARVYNTTLKMPGFKLASTLRSDQRAWLQRLPATCDASKLSSKALSKCLFREYQNRFSHIDFCTESVMNELSWDAKAYSNCLKDTLTLSK